MKFFSILFIYFLYFVKLNNAVTMKSGQLAPAQAIISSLFSVSNYGDPCSYVSPSGDQIFTCTNDGTNVYTVTAISTGAGNSATPKMINTAMSLFPDLNSINIGKYYSVSTASWANLNQLSKLIYLEIASLTVPFPSNIVLPPSNLDINIYFCSVPFPDGLFSTGSLVNLYVEDSSNGFTLPSTISSCNSKLAMFWVPISYYNTLPSNLDSCKGLTDIYIYIQNDKSVAGYTDFNFPTFKLYPYCKSLGIYFKYSEGATNIQTWEFPVTLQNQPTITYFEIHDIGFTLPSSGILDLSLYGSGLLFDLKRVGFMNSCQLESGCLKLPTFSKIQFTSLGLNLTNIDYTNIASISINQNTLSQALPTPSTIKHSQVALFSLTNSQFIGSIPTTNNFYCKFNSTVLRLYGNQLNGTVPSCYSCIGPNSDGSNSILGAPNSFTGFTSSSIPPNPCPTLGFNSIPLVKTNQITVITLSGTDFGWNMQLVSPPISPNNPSISILVPNSQVLITIPKGDGTSKSIVTKFGYNFQTTKTFIYSYEVPVVFPKYSYSGSNMILTGTGFSYVNPNSVFINSVSATTQIAVSSSENSTNDQISVPNTAIQSLFEGNTITLSVSVGGQSSASVSLYYFKQVSISFTPLYTIGGTVSFSGVFGTTNKNLVSVKIDGIVCTIISISLSSISILYPDTTIGNKEFILTLGNSYQYKSVVSYTLPPKPTLLNKYSWKTIDIDQTLVLYGTYFSTFATNIATINGVDFLSTPAVASTSNPGYQEITFNSAISSLQTLNIGDTFSVQTNVGGQLSNTVLFNLIHQIVINTKPLDNIGGKHISFLGSYGVSSTNAIVSLKIDSQSVSGKIDLTPSSLTFDYPSKLPGSYFLLLNVGGLDYQTNVTYVATSPPILLNTFSWNSNNLMVLSGTSFSYYGINTVVINGNENNVGLAIVGNNGLDSVILPSTAIALVTVGTSFTVSIKVIGQQSNTQTFYHIKPISMVTRPLATNGGSITFSGVFSTNNKLIATLSIDGTPCTINAIVSTSISFYYPYRALPGTYNLNLNIGGLVYNTSLTYDNSPVPKLLNRYSWKTLQNGDKTLVFYGKDFTYYNTMVATINGVDYISTFGEVSQSALYNGYDQITFTSVISGIESLIEGEVFSVQVIVGSQSTNTVTFTLVNSISMQIQSLYYIGGVTSFTGVFVVSSTNNVSLLMGGINVQLQVLEISPSTIKFQYPNNAGTYPLILNIGGLEYQAGNVQYVHPPPPTILNKYSWSADNLLSLDGTWFSYFGVPNIIIVNGTSSLASTASPSSIQGYDNIKLTSASPTNSLQIGDTFYVQVDVYNQKSNIVNLIFVLPISVTTFPLNSTGGLASFSGSFSVSNTKNVSLLIDDQVCSVNTISPSSITFNYPASSKPNVIFLINIGGLEYSTIVQYTTPPAPTLLNTYKWTGDNKLLFTGTSFKYVNPNILFINDIEYTSTVVSGSSILGHDQITFTDINSSPSLSEDQQFSVVLKTGDLLSNLIVFNYIEPISMTTQDLYVIGGKDISFAGVYGTSNKSIVTLSINGSTCTIDSITPTSIIFSYQQQNEIGLHNLLLNIGGLEYSTTVNFILQQKPTLLNNYYWSSYDIIVFRGIGFSFISPISIVNINGVGFTPSLAKSNGSFDEITFSDNSATIDLSEGDYFETSVSVGTKTSNIVNFIFIKSITMSIVPLNQIGGNISFNGEYHTDNKAFASLSIDGIDCIIGDLKKTMITFSYPSKPIGQYNLILNIGGFEFKTTIHYSDHSTTGSQSTTTGSQTTTTGSQTITSSQSTTTSSPSSSLSSDDSPSTSSKLQTQIILTFFIFSLFLLL